MGRHREIERLFLNELVSGEERALRAVRLIKYQQKMIENLEKIVTRANVDSKGCQTESTYHDVSMDAETPCMNIGIKEIDQAIVSSSISVHSSIHSDTCDGRSTSSLSAGDFKSMTDSTPSNKTSMKSVSFEKTLANEDSISRLVELLNSSACQENSKRSTDTEVARKASLRNARTTHSIVNTTESNQILRSFERIQSRLKNLQINLMAAKRWAPSDDVQLIEIQNQLQNIKDEAKVTAKVMKQIDQWKLHLKSAINENCWNTKGDLVFSEDRKALERWRTANNFFTAEQAYFFLTADTDKTLRT